MIHLNRVHFLLGVSAILLLTMLGARELWTQEYRWAGIVSEMFARHDFFHPYLNGAAYYDKPLLSYWLIALGVLIKGDLSPFVLRIPSALAGLVAIVSIYRLGFFLKGRALGLLAGWMLLTTFYFVFWARTSSADMLNMAGILFAVSWYCDKKAQPTFGAYFIFFLILAFTALCKGLIGPVVVSIVVLAHLILTGDWRRQRYGLVSLALLPALALYVLPFWLSSLWGGGQYQTNGLYLVYKENFLRYFQPFDHQGPIYTYFLYLPVYLLPWTLFFIPALITLKPRWQKLSLESKWISWVILLLFCFFSLSGSRRGYYILPVIPFAILFTAEWLLETQRVKTALAIAFGSMACMLCTFLVILPLYYQGAGLSSFAQKISRLTLMNQPYQILMVRHNSKLVYYLKKLPQAKLVNLDKPDLKKVVALTKQKHRTIIIGEQRDQKNLQFLLPNYQVIKVKPNFGEGLNKNTLKTLPIALIPRFRA